MTIQARTLGSVIGQTTEQRRGQDSVGETDVSRSYSSFLTLFSINLVHRFPDVTDLNTIDYETVRRIAELSGVCSTIALEVWDEITRTHAQRLSRQSRVA